MPPHTSPLLPGVRLNPPLRGVAWAGLVATLLFTFGYWRYSVEELDRVNADRFNQLAERQVLALADRIRDYERVLLGARALFAASEAVERDEWRRYVESLDLEASLPGIQGTGFAVVVPRERRAAHEAAMRAQGFPDYRIEPPGERPVYSSIVFLEPFAGRNLRAFGYDMYSDPARRIAMNRARDTGEPAMTHKVTLVQENGEDVQPGVLIYVPVYARARPLTTAAERAAALLGWVYSPFRTHDLMQSAFGQFEGDAEVEVFDGGHSRENLLYASAGAGRGASYTASYPIEIGGITWTARFRSSESFEARIDHAELQLVLLSGALLSLLVFSLLYVESRHRSRLETQVRERTVELERARDEAESANRAKSAFLATVSHELRTPLNAIIGFSSILLQDVPGTEQRKQLTIINRSGLQLLDLIKEILDITSIEAGQVAIEIEPVDLRSVLEEQCEAMQVQAAEAGLWLRLGACDAAVRVLADRGRLSQVVRNLLANAVKFTDRGGVTVSCLASGEVVLVEVVDTGIGIPAAQHPTVFVPFQRGDRRHAHRPGTGLGLAICRRLVEAMGGQIGFESAPGKGSRFWFTVPRAAARQALA